MADIWDQANQIVTATPERGATPPPQPQQPAPQQLGAVGNLFNATVNQGAGWLANAGIRAASRVGLISPERAQQAIGTQLPTDPNSLAAKAGGMIGGAAPALFGPLAPAMMTVQAAENSREQVDARNAELRQQGLPELSAAQQMLTVGGQAALGYGMGKLMPGQRIGSKIIGATPTLANVLLNAGKNIAVGAGVGAVEQNAFNIAANTINKATNVDPNATWNQGWQQATGQGAIFGGVGQALHEAPNAVNRLFPKKEAANVPVAEGQTTPAETKPPVQEARPAEGEKAQTPPEESKTEGTQGVQPALKGDEAPPFETRRELLESAQRGQQLASEHAAAKMEAPPREGEEAPKVEEKPALGGNEAPLFETRKQLLESAQRGQQLASEHAAAKMEAPPREGEKALEKHPATLADPEAVAQHYADTYGEKDPAQIGAIQSMMGMKLSPGEKFVKATVPSENLETANFMAGDKNPAKIAAIQNLSSEERAKLPPVYANKDGMVADGVHRVSAAQNLGEPVTAYVPESMVGKNGVTLATETAKETTPSATQNQVEQKPQSDFFARIKAKGAQAAELGKRLATEEEGGAAMTASKKFAEQDVLPKVDAAATGLKKLTQGLKNTFGAQSGSEAEATKSLLKGRGAELAQRMDQIHDQSRKAEAMIDTLPKEDQHAITDAAERGEKQSDPRFQKVADYIRSVMDDRLQQIQDRDPEFKGLPDYMGHAWKQPDRANSVLQEFLTRKPLQGDKGFTKGRSIVYQSEGIKAGLEPVTDNPVTMAKLKAHQMDKWITAFDLKKNLTDRGLIQDAPTGNGKVPEGYSQVSDPMFRGKILPDPVASVINNTLSSGPLGHPLYGPALRGLTGVANTINQSNLGLSAFHATESAINSAVSEFAMGIKKTVEGKPVEGVKSMGLAFTGVGPAARDYWNGSRMLKEWLKPGTTDAQTATIVDAMKAQGGRAGMDKFYATNMTDKMLHAFRTGNYIGAALRSPLAAIETTSKPIMNFLVPRLKMGAFFQMAQHALSDNPNLSGEELSGKMGDAWRSVDNRFGEMVHDNRFWSQTARHVANATFRSVGWNFGTADELGGGVVDWAKMLGRVAQGKTPEMTHKMAYTVALPALVGTWGAMLHYAMTGTAPQSMKDAFFPKTGDKDKNGDDVRINLPTYMKDVFNVAHSPLGTVANKLHPAVGMTIDMLKNKDFYGTKIANEDDPFYKQMLDRVQYAGKQSSPISLQNILSDKPTTTKEKVLPFVGITKAPKWMSQSDATQAAYQAINESQPIGGRTAEATAKSNLISGLSDRMRKDDPHVDADVDKAIDAGKLTNQDYKTIVKQSQGPTGLAGLIQRPELRGKPELLEKVWDKMTHTEKSDNGDAMYKTISHSKAMDPDKRDALLEKINKETTKLAGVQ